MRMVAIILAMAAMATALVHLRRAETAARHDVQRLEAQQRDLRLQLGDQQIRFSRETAPGKVRDRLAELGVDMSGRAADRPTLAERDRPRLLP